jgi:hypothetical protein
LLRLLRLRLLLLACQQVTIQEGRFVILSQQRAEQAIAAHAVQVTTDLGDTAAELADVFNKLKTSLQVTSGDRDALKVRGHVARAMCMRCVEHSNMVASAQSCMCFFWQSAHSWSTNRLSDAAGRTGAHPGTCVYSAGMD